ncbi:phosphate ABC transporter permease PstA [Phenylobacterium sp.]|uniref:phosphate ABC transporter permease PstA n=1 Tax=Phenylobacterium sp. TaxID=1871053 RepID=UPI00374D32A2
MSAGKLIRRKVGDVAFKAFCVVVTVIALVALTAILWSLLKQGVGGLDLDIFTKRTMSSGSKGGLANAIVGSIVMCSLAMVLALGVGILAGTWLAEYGGRSAYGAVVRFLNDVLLSAPSILVGLFVYEILVAPFHGFSGFAGSVALALLAVPVITRTTEDVLLLQAATLREAGVALGAPLSYIIRTVLWRSARSGLLTGALLAFARISGETAPLLFTALNNQFFSLDLRHPTANLPVVIYNSALSAYDDLVRLAWVGALLIAATVLAVTVVARIVAQEQRRS